MPRTQRLVLLAAVAGLAVTTTSLTACRKREASPARTVEAAPEQPQLSATVARQADPTPSPDAAPPAPPPQRQPGLWSQTVVSRGVTQTSRICIGPHGDSRLTLWGQAVGGKGCSRTEMQPAGGGWTFESRCDGGSGAKVVSRGEARGDFARAYTIDVASVTTGSEMPQANGRRTMTLQARFEGPCPAGMKPGDVQLPGGVKINVAQVGTH